MNIEFFLYLTTLPVSLYYSVMCLLPFAHSRLHFPRNLGRTEKQKIFGSERETQLTLVENEIKVLPDEIVWENILCKNDLAVLLPKNPLYLKDIVFIFEFNLKINEIAEAKWNKVKVHHLL